MTMKAWHKVAVGTVVVTVVLAAGVVEYANWHVGRQSHAALATGQLGKSGGSSSQSSSSTTNSAQNNVVIKVVSSTSVNSTAQTKVISAVEQMIQAGPSSVPDASGFVEHALAAAGVTVPRTIAEQSKTGTLIAGTNQLQAGDMVFFGLNSQNPNQVTFDGIYMGNGKFTALTGHGMLTISMKDPYWGPRFLFGRRVL
ncbi:C40 family peptidase [Alicyclobacillus curvatus]|nr:C40 family peptidase [Alicyclobacillus curvatus]